jgi:hypothetical protein
MPRLLLQVALDGSDACLATGLCGLVEPVRPVAPGLMFLAVGLVAAGIWGLRRRRHAESASASDSPATTD